MQQPLTTTYYAYSIFAFGVGTSYLIKRGAALEAPPMPPTTITNVSVVHFFVSEARRMDISIEWNPPQYTNGQLTEYQIWIGRIVLNDTDPVIGEDRIYTSTTVVSSYHHKY